MSAIPENAFWETLETPLVEEPLFYAQKSDGLRDWAETPRQRKFLNDMHMLAPSILCFAIPNAGKRNPRLARLEGIMGGVFDVCCQWEGGAAWIEFKGYRQRRAGELSEAQIRWGNRMHNMGKHVACFYSPDSAVQWIKGFRPEA